MTITITFKLTPETRGELIDTYGAQYRDFRATMEQAHAQGGFGPPDKARLRWLLDSGRWGTGGSADV